VKAAWALLPFLIAMPALAQGTPVQMAFLQAADAGDVAAMGRMLPGRIGVRGGTTMPAREFLRQVGGCYLRRVGPAEGGAVLASWMCKDGEGSKIVVARVLDADGALALEGLSETPLKTPPPPRTGSALGGM
jgi:hypothetical protein